MAFFKLDTNVNVLKHDIFYNYYETDIKFNDIRVLSNKKIGSVYPDLFKKKEIEGTEIIDKDTFYKININNKQPSFTYNELNPSSYITKQIYLYNVLHNNIVGVTDKDNDSIIGEIVIEHVNFNNPKQKIYSCFFITPDKEKHYPNDLDKLVTIIENKTNKRDMSIDLNKCIPTQSTCFNYVNEDSFIFIFTNPIKVNDDTAMLFSRKLTHTTHLFPIHPPYDYKLIKMSNEKENFTSNIITEGMANDEDKIEIKCTPTGVSDETIQAYTVPINSAFSNSKTKIELFKTIINFLLFILVIGASYAFIPPFYKQIVIDKINNWKYGNRDENIKDRQNHIAYADLWIVIILLAHITLSFMYGIQQDSSAFMSIGIGFFVLLSAGYALIKLNKINPAFMTTTNNEIGNIETIYDYDNEIEEPPFSFFQAILAPFTFLVAHFKKFESSNEYDLDKIIKWFLFIIIISLLIFGFIKALGDTSAYTDHMEFFILMSITVSNLIYLLMT